MKASERNSDIQHLISRAGFGFSPKSFQITKGNGIKAVARMIFEETKAPQPFELVSKPAEETKPIDNMPMNPEDQKKVNQEKRKFMRQQIEQLNSSWLKKMQDSTFGLNEKMTLFWHGHFACRTDNSYFMQQYYNTLNAHAVGNFADLLFAVSKTPAMLQFLNNQQNRKAHPNENFAREVMELFTLGRGNYTENDIRESARAFTGWGFKNTGDFVFREKQHDEGSKKFLGRTGNFNGDDILNIIIDQPYTAIFITEKIYRYFVNETPDSRLIEKLAHNFRKSKYDISKLLHEIFTSQWFYLPENKGILIKSPVELLCNIMRVNDVTVEKPQVIYQFQKLLGQILFNPPNVAGWKGGKSWIDSSSLMMRMRLPGIFYYDKEFLAQAKVDGADLDSDFYAAQLAQERQNENYLKQAHQRVEAILHWEPYLSLFDAIPQEQLFDTIVSLHIHTTGLGVSRENLEVKVDKSNRNNYIKGITTLIMSAPEYQLS